MPRQLRTRPATPADLPFLMRLRKRTMHAHLARAGERLDDDWHHQRVMAHFDSAHIVCLDETPVGLFKHYRTQEEWVLVQIQLLPEHQGQGIGERLIRGLLDDARQAGLPVALSVLHGNPARRLYERLGFEQTAARGNEFEMRCRPSLQAR
ncbi:GNAT family N-acetyltransferase [Bordetella sp. FB-8]|uniref:GNAT family N-acetyltransferase n=1 Tax=Bordetella sp. FB-8 TaxID=1159870 RepID=UPI0012DCB48A|nr:GNAT family N-acetyltransferase [Bordetella sp. FB-8]